MKPMNFPARKNARRERALVNLRMDVRSPFTGAIMPKQTVVIERTEAALNADARSVRTKKSRVATAKFAR